MLRRAVWVGWPSFLMAGLLEMLVFSAADPAELHALGDLHARLGAEGLYCLAFACFWAVTATACAITLALASPERGGRG